MQYPSWEKPTQYLFDPWTYFVWPTRLSSQSPSYFWLPKSLWQSKLKKKKNKPNSSTSPSLENPISDPSLQLLISSLSSDKPLLLEKPTLFPQEKSTHLLLPKRIIPILLWIPSDSANRYLYLQKKSYIEALKNQEPSPSKILGNQINRSEFLPNLHIQIHRSHQTEAMIGAQPIVSQLGIMHSKQILGDRDVGRYQSNPDIEH